jgi:hypothetical protein
VTFAVQDQTESWLVSNNGGRKLADNQRRNLAGMGGRWLSTPNAWDPTEDSVAQYTAENETTASTTTTSSRRIPCRSATRPSGIGRCGSCTATRSPAPGTASAGSVRPWINLDRSRPRSSRCSTATRAGRAVLPEPQAGHPRRSVRWRRWDELAKAGTSPDGRSSSPALTARASDALAVIATVVETGYQWPSGSGSAQSAATTTSTRSTRSTARCSKLFDRFNVWRVYIDPQYIDHLVDEWQGRWGEKRVMHWYTNRPRADRPRGAELHATALAGGDLVARRRRGLRAPHQERRSGASERQRRRAPARCTRSARTAGLAAQDGRRDGRGALVGGARLEPPVLDPTRFPNARCGDLPTQDELRSQLKRYSAVLDKRAGHASTLDRYREGVFPLPPLTQDSGITQAYRMLMDLSGSNWPGLIVSAVEERLEVQGVRFGDQDADEEVWSIWQANGLDAESSMLHDSVLTTGRGYAIVWGDGSNNPEPQVTLEHASLCVVEYEPGNRRRRGALRRWFDTGRWYANLYRPEAIYKFKAKQTGEDAPKEGLDWDSYEKLDNPLGEVPVVEFAVNRSLRPSLFGTGRGEFADNLRHIDRINYKVFSGLVALTWSGFPLRYVIGDPILYEKKDDGQGGVVDDKTKPIPPFKALASAVAQFTNPNAKVGQLPEADIANYSPEMDIKHLAALTKTPAYYLLGELVNISADGIRAGEGGLISKVRRHMRSLGESWEDVTRLSLRVKNPDDPRGRDDSAQIIWKDPESRSMAERADAATKLKDVLPQRALMQFVLGLTPQEISRFEADQAGTVLQQIMEQAQQPPSGNGVVPSAIGAG